jgi:hypothetical protein
VSLASADASSFFSDTLPFFSALDNDDDDCANDDDDDDDARISLTDAAAEEEKESVGGILWTGMDED